MTRTQKIILWSLGTLIGLFLIGLLWVNSLFQSQQISENIYLITSPTGANVTMFTGEEGILLVDTQLSALSFFIRREIKAISDKEIKYIINTHWHPDHTGGNSKLANDAVIIGHENLKTRMSTHQKGYGLTKPGSYHEFKPRADTDWPNKTFRDTLNLFFNGERITVSYVKNGHTDSDVIVHFTNQAVLCVGDLIWKDQFPYVDTFNRGSVIGLANALDLIVEKAPPGSRIISGHSSPASPRDIVKTAEMIRESVAFVEARRNEGRSLDEIIGQGLPQALQGWSGDLVPEASWIEMVYNSLK